MEILTTILTILLIVAGFVGLFIPVIPGTPLMFAGMLIYGFADGFEHVTLLAFSLIAVLMLLGVVAEYLATSLGAKTMGASKAGIAGAIIGAVVGLLTSNFFGFLLGPFIGAVLFELVFARKELAGALRSGGGAVLGLLSSVVMKITIALMMITLFIGALLV